MINFLKQQLSRIGFGLGYLVAVVALIFLVAGIGVLFFKYPIIGLPVLILIAAWLVGYIRESPFYS